MKTKTVCLVALLLLAAAVSCGATRTLLDSHEVEAQPAGCHRPLHERHSIARQPPAASPPALTLLPRLQAPSGEAAGKPDICKGEWEGDEFECYFACADDSSPAPYEVECKCEDDCTKAACYIKSPAQQKFTFECPVEGGRVSASALPGGGAGVLPSWGRAAGCCLTCLLVVMQVVSCDPAAWDAPTSFELLPCVSANATSIISAWRPSDD